MLDHQARKDATYDETAEVFGEIQRLASIIDATHFVATAAILYSDEIGWAWNQVVSTRLRGMLSDVDISDQGRVLRWYQALYREKISTDIIDPLSDLSAYSVVLVPDLYLINEQIVTNLETYVRQGGWLLVGPKAGLKNWQNVFLTDVPPGGGLAEVFGATVKRTPHRMGFGVLPDMSVHMQSSAPFAGHTRFANEGLFDVLEPAEAASIACFANGETAITLNQYGDGVALYVGCEPEEAFYRQLVRWLIAEGKVTPPLATDADVEVTLRSGEGHDLIFVLNHNQHPEAVTLEGAYRDLISDQTYSGEMVIEGQGVRILERVKK